MSKMFWGTLVLTAIGANVALCLSMARAQPAENRQRAIETTLRELRTQVATIKAEKVSGPRGGWVKTSEGAVWSPERTERSDEYTIEMGCNTGSGVLTY